MGAGNREDSVGTDVDWSQEFDRFHDHDKNGNSKEAVKVNRRTLCDVAKHDLGNILAFLVPIIILHNLAWILKPYLMDVEDQRGPWEFVWYHVVQAFGEDRKLLGVVGTFSATFSCFVLGNIFFAFLDYYQWPRFLYKYKIQTSKNSMPDQKKIIKLIKGVTVNLVISFVLMELSWPTYAQRSDPDPYSVPSIWGLLGHLFAAVLGHDVMFYHVHRFLHHRLIYKHIHKGHHEWTAPIAAATYYSHPLEHILAGSVPTSAGFMFTVPQIPVMWIWYTWLTWMGMHDHSGYHFPIMYSNEFHDFHHLRFHTCFGFLTFWDWLYGTDQDFESSDISKRHIRLQTLKSARELFPDEKKED